jgi:hypothetical protein
MVVENVRAVVCRRGEKEEDLALWWASNVELERSGALTTAVLLRAVAAALAKLRRAMALMSGAAMEGRLTESKVERRDDCTANDFSMAMGREERKKVGCCSGGFGCHRLSSARTTIRVGNDGVWPRQGVQ